MFLRQRIILLAVTATLILLALAGGCSQNQDVVRSRNRATIELIPENLPTLDPTRYIYELWLANTRASDSDYTSLGRFKWNFAQAKFTDPNGNPLTGVYDLPGFYSDHDRIMLSVENIGTNNLRPSGTIMLLDTLVDPSVRQVIMRFPLFLFEVNNWKWFAGTPTDDDTLSNEQMGLWLCSRAITQRTNHDTLDIDSLIVTQTEPADSGDMITWEYRGVAWPAGSTWNVESRDTLGDTTWIFSEIDGVQDNIWNIDTTVVIFGYDTIPHRRITNLVFDSIRDPDHDYRLYFGYGRTDNDIDSLTINQLFHTGVIQFFNYSNPVEKLPEVSELQKYGWRFAGWVIANSSVLPGLPPMQPFGYEWQYKLTGDSSYNVLALGSFYSHIGPDFSNPYNSNREVPNFPGSDFIITPPLPTPPPPAPDFKSFSAGYQGNIRGSVVIGLEPDPSKLSIDSTRNFPVFFMADSLVAGASPSAVQDFHNYSQYMPRINVTVKFRE